MIRVKKALLKFWKLVSSSSTFLESFRDQKNWIPNTEYTYRRIRIRKPMLMI